MDAEKSSATVTPGMFLSGYRIEQLLGRGGMGSVFLAHDTRLHRRVAIKILDTLGDAASARDRLMREARSAAALNHPNICTILEVGDDDPAFIAMEYVEGTPLSEKLRSGPLSLDATLNIGVQAADALAHAHEHSVIHRDFKAANIIIGPGGRVKIVDFGLARRSDPLMSEATTRASLAEPGVVAGTPYAMSPEQVCGTATDARTDIWALGVLLHQMASGRHPFKAPSAPELFSAILRDAPAPLPDTTPAELQAIVSRCLEKDPAQRYQTAAEATQALDAMRAEAAGEARLQSARSASRRRIIGMLLTAAVIFAAGAAISLNLPAIRNLVSGSVSAPLVDTLAVLPLENLTGAAEQEYLTAGIHEGIITELAQLPGLRRVIARRSFRNIDTAKASLPDIATRLGVRALVTGSVSRSGDRVRLTVQLIDVRTQQQLWTNQYERDANDVLALSNDVAAAIAQAIGVTPSAEQQQRFAQSRHIDPKVYEAYLRGMALIEAGTPRNLQEGLTYLQQAVEADPANPDAYAGLANGYAAIGHGPNSVPDAWQRARAAAQRALTLDPTLAEAHAAMADVKMYYEWDWAGAEREFKRANELNPNLAMNHYHYAWYKALFGRWDEAIAEHKRSQELDPLTPLHTAWLGAVYGYMGRTDEAIVEARKALEINQNAVPGWIVLGYAQAEKGNFKEAIEAHTRARELNNAWRGGLAITYLKAGRREDAMTIVRDLEAKPNAFSAFFLAQLYAHLGDLDGAFKWAAFEPAHGFLPWLRTDPGMVVLRKDPRFADLMRRMHLPMP